MVSHGVGGRGEPKLTVNQCLTDARSSRVCSTETVAEVRGLS